MTKLILSSLFVILVTTSVLSQTQSIFVNPQTTDPQIDTFLSPHFVARNPSTTPRNQLLVFFPGTGGTPVAYRTFVTLAADMGYHAIGLNYVNGEAVNELCGPMLDLNCYGNFRLEILDGTDRSNLVSVNRANSIENRLMRLLIYMQQINPAANWAQFLDGQNGIRWDKLVVAGHSQGGGHAGIIGKNHRVARVIMFAAMDFSGALNSVANWIVAAGVTPNADFYGFSHQQDEEVNYTLLSTRAWTAYGMNAFGAPVNVDNSAPPYSNTHSLNSNFPTIPSGSNYHGAVVVDTRFPVDINGVSIYEPVWRYLLNTNSALSLLSLQFLRLGQPVSRPLVGTTTKAIQLVVNGIGFEATSQVVINGVNAETEFVNASEVRAKLPAGRVGSIGNSTVQVRNLNGSTSNLVNY